MAQAVSNDDAVFRCDDFEAMRLAACAGLGVALLPEWVVVPDVRSGALVPLGFGGEVWSSRPVGIWLLRALAQPSARLQVLSEALRETAGRLFL